MLGKISIVFGFVYLYLIISTIIGLISTFSNSILLGIISLIVSPYACITGVLYPFVSISEIVQNWVHFPI